VSYARVPLGEACGPCFIQSGADCEICPDDANSDFPECAGCVNGVRASLVTAAESSIILPVVAGVLTTLLGVWLTSRLLHEDAAS
jgi:hypothetical protein